MPSARPREVRFGTDQLGNDVHLVESTEGGILLRYGRGHCLAIDRSGLALLLKTLREWGMDPAYDAVRPTK